MEGSREKTAANFLILEGSVMLGVYRPEGNVFLVEHKPDGSGWAIAVFFYLEVGDILLFFRNVGAALIFAVHKNYQVGILLYGSGFAQVRKTRAFIVALIHFARELG